MAEQATRTKEAGVDWRPYVASAPGIVLFLTMVIAPLLMTFALSFNGFDFNSGIQSTYGVQNYWQVLASPYFHEIFLRTFAVAGVTTIACLLIGVPEAYVLSRMRSPWRAIFLIVILGPLLVSVVVRAFGWSMLLGSEGPINLLLVAVGIGRVKLLFTNGAMIVALVHVMLPFMVIPVWTALQRLDPAVEQAALSLRASQFTVMRRIVLPQVLPGVLSGSLIVFGLSASAFAIPGLLGGRRLKVVATAVYDEFLSSLNWPLGATIAIVLLLANLVIMLSYNRLLEGRHKATLG
jgi:putative spermidine/putrescine transport system permease protein